MSGANHDNGETPALASSGTTDPIVEACLAGDRSAMHQLYQRCSGRIYGLMVRMVGQQDADDLTQQAFLQMFRKLHQFSGESKLETWLYRLATNEALQHIRWQKRRAASALVVDPVADTPDLTAKSEEARLVELAIARLEPELRAVLLLKEQQQCSYREIAESVGIPEGTVGSRLNRARKALKQELIQLGWD